MNVLQSRTLVRKFMADLSTKKALATKELQELTKRMIVKYENTLGSHKAKARNRNALDFCGLPLNCQD